MTVSELVELLGSYPPDMRVVVDGYEEGYDDVLSERVAVVKAQLDLGTKSWEGQHREWFSLKENPNNKNEITEVLALRRRSNFG